MNKIKVFFVSIVLALAMVMASVAPAQAAIACRSSNPIGYVSISKGSAPAGKITAQVWGTNSYTNSSTRLTYKFERYTITNIKTGVTSWSGTYLPRFHYIVPAYYRVTMRWGVYYGGRKQTTISCSNSWGPGVYSY